MDNPWIHMFLASFLVALVAVAIFKFASRPSLIVRRRNRMIARLLEMFLYQESLSSMLRASGRLFRALGSYSGAMLLPLLAAVVVVVPLLVCFEPLLARAPVQAGEEFLVEARVASGVEFPDLSGFGVIEVSAPPVRIGSEGRAVWRFAGSATGAGGLSFGEDAEKVDVPVAVGSGVWIVPRWTSSALHALLPGVGRLDGSGELAVGYPERSYRVAKAELDWLTAVTVFSLLVSIPMAFLFRLSI